MYKYFAFISYSSKDVEWGKRVQKKLEGYRMPSTLCSQHGWPRTPMRPIFFAPTDIQPGELTVELQERMKASRHLIVICSPNSAQSKWVGKEISYFHSLGRAQNIHFFIIDGRHSGNEKTKCFNPVVTELGLSGVLGVNIHEKVSRWPWINKERAYVQLITKLLGVEFDSIWRRHQRMMIQHIVAWTVGIIVVISALLGVWFTNQPVDIKVGLKETSIHNDILPPLQNAIVTLTLNNETKTDTINSLEEQALFHNVPHSAIGKEIHATVTCKDWLTVDTTFVLSEDVNLNITRDTHPYGDIQFRLWNIQEETTYPFKKVSINGHEAKSDAEGRVTYFMPLAEQASFYIIRTSKILETDTLYMPTNEYTIIEVK